MTTPRCGFCGATQAHLEWYPLFKSRYCPPCLERKMALTMITIDVEIRRAHLPRLDG